MKRKRKNNIQKVGDHYVGTVHTGVTNTPEAEPCSDQPAPGEKVFKFQRPITVLCGTPPPNHPPILVYNQNRSIQVHLHVSPEIEILFGPDDVKAYAVCNVVKGIPVPVRRVAAQPW